MRDISLRRAEQAAAAAIAVAAVLLGLHVAVLSLTHSRADDSRLPQIRCLEMQCLQCIILSFFYNGLCLTHRLNNNYYNYYYYIIICYILYYYILYYYYYYYTIIIIIIIKSMA